MKKIVLVLLLMSVVTTIWSQENVKFRIPLLGESAPSFTAESTNGTINFPGDFGKKWKVLFSHPQDFTPVCSSELIELAALQSEFDKLGVKLVIISTDKLETHVKWIQSLEEIKYKDRATEKIKFPLVDDYSKSVSKMYGMLQESSNSTKDVRGVFIIDPNDVVQSINFYPMSVGRNTSEIIRTITALQVTAKGEYSTPANWNKGNDLLVPVPPKADPNNPGATPEGYYRLSWYMLFKKAGMVN